MTMNDSPDHPETEEASSSVDFAFDEEKLNPAIDVKVFRFQLPVGAKLVEEAQ